jgi:osmotically inducible lipoprotein OsmB
MKTIQRLAVSGIFAAVMLGIASCSGMSTQDKYTAGGAVAGGLGGAALGGGTLGTLGGAAVGGVIGHQVGKDKDKK